MTALEDPPSSAPTIRHTSSPRALGEHRTWVIDVTIHNAQQQPCLSSPSSGGVVHVVQAAKVSTWAEPLAGTAECLSSYLIWYGGFGPGTLAFVRDAATARATVGSREERDGALGPCM